ncbi:MAG TPA: SUMF1/EgtB/PvdO family nonheme iron enzyme, partial [Gemmatales bacterium]|nr:SUMF1/EgtB/PvdO family nonheme iron enzyme [Gemmatales bacterium]
ATFAPDDSRWQKVSLDVASTVVIQKPLTILKWTEAVKGAGKWLLPSLANFLVDEKRTLTERGLIASVYGTFAADLPNGYDWLEKELAEPLKPSAFAEVKIALARKQANIVEALMVMGRTEKVWPLLKHQPDPTLRSYLIERMGPAGVNAGLLIARLEEEKEVSVKRAILLSLGGFEKNSISINLRLNLVTRLRQLYWDEPDSGMHGAIEWLLRQWEQEAKLQEIDKELGTGKVEGKRQWYVNKQGQTLVVIPNSVVLWMGEGHLKHKRKIGRSFAIASKEVTVEQFLRFRKDHNFYEEHAPTSNCPVNSVSWYDAVEYCNWLSEKDGIPKDQWCYLPNNAGKYAVGMKMAPNYLTLTGYRLPTEAEWEYACKAKADSAYSFGESVDVLGSYAWYKTNSLSKTHPVGSLKPNDLGLSDMYGNAFEWTQTAHREYPKKGQVLDDIEEVLEIKPDESRILRGGSCFLELTGWSLEPFYNEPSNSIRSNGFRPSRTLPFVSNRMTPSSETVINNGNLPTTENNEARALFDRMEKKLAEADTIQLTLVGKMTLQNRIPTEVPPNADDGTVKASVLIAQGNKLHLDYLVQSRAPAEETTIVSDGRKQSTRHNKTNYIEIKTSNFLRAKLIHDLSCIGFTQSLLPMQSELPVESDPKDNLQVSDFWLDKQEKIGGRDVYVLHYQYAFTNEDRKFETTLYIDAKTYLPVARITPALMNLREEYQYRLNEKIDEEKFALPK